MKNTHDSKGHRTYKKAQERQGMGTRMGTHGTTTAASGGNLPILWQRIDAPDSP